MSFLFYDFVEYYPYLATVNNEFEEYPRNTLSFFREHYTLEYFKKICSEKKLTLRLTHHISKECFNNIYTEYRENCPIQTEFIEGKHLIKRQSDLISITNFEEGTVEIIYGDRSIIYNKGDVIYAAMLQFCTIWIKSSKPFTLKHYYLENKYLNVLFQHVFNVIYNKKEKYYLFGALYDYFPRSNTINKESMEPIWELMCFGMVSF